MEPHFFSIKLFSIIFLLNLLNSSVIHAQWHYPNQYISPFQQQQQIKSQLKRNQYSEESSSTTTVKPQSSKPEDIMAASPDIPYYPPSSSHGQPPSLRCGESFNCTSSGIFHSPFKPVLENERCVWTVVVPGASGYRIEVLYLGWDPKENNKNGVSNQVLINGFKRNGPPSEILITGKGVHLIEDATLLVITFISGENPNNDTTGFILQYTTLTNGTVPKVAENSKNEFIQPHTIYLRHPSTSSKYYENNELSSFVFQPENNIHLPGKRINLVYMRIVLDGGKCEDYVDVYGLNVTGSVASETVGNEVGEGTGPGMKNNGYGGAKWDFKGRICGYLDTQLISNDDMLMMIFQTDGSGTNYGFHLTYTTC